LCVVFWSWGWVPVGRAPPRPPPPHAVHLVDGAEITLPATFRLWLTGGGLPQDPCRAEEWSTYSSEVDG
jgi:hypothetical protein